MGEIEYIITAVSPYWMVVVNDCEAVRIENSGITAFSFPPKPMFTKIEAFQHSSVDLSFLSTSAQHPSVENNSEVC